MALRLSLFKTPKHRVFTYRPIFYDPVKEELNERIERIRAEMEESDPNNSNPREKRPYNPGSIIRGSFRKAARRETPRRGGENKYIRVIAVLTIAALIAVALYLADGIRLLFEAVSNQRIP